MGRQLIILDFRENLGLQTMSELVGRGFLWCGGTPANKANAAAIWATPQDEMMTLTVMTGPLAQSERQLDDLIAAALEHHPQVTSVEVRGFADPDKASKIAGRHGLLPATAGESHLYLRSS